MVGLSINIMKCIFPKNKKFKGIWPDEIKDYSYITLYFRRLKCERLYLGKWYKSYYFVPVNPDNDTKHQYCIELSPSYSLMVDNSLLYEHIYSLRTDISHYKELVESDWEQLNKLPFNDYVKW